MSLLEGMSAEEAFTRLMRSFCTRFTQGVVQSRMVCEARQPCQPVTDRRTWFNVVIDEIGEIAAHLKRNMEIKILMDDTVTDTPCLSYSPLEHPFALEFTLHTADGDYLPVELWVIWLDVDQMDENVNLHNGFYPQLSTLLKSVLMASRFTPLYRHYARRQDADSFVILYKVSIAHPDVAILGDGRRHHSLGSLPTPFGTLRMDLYYRTKMELSPSEILVDKLAAAALQKSHRIETSGEGLKSQAINALQVTDLYGNVVPAKGSDVIASSPGLEDVNRFNTGTRDEENFPLVESLEELDRTSLRLGRCATVTAGASTMRDAVAHELDANIRHLSAGSETNSSPVSKPSSFPQRASKLLRIRNNSFPFASLLTMDLHGSNDQFRSQILPEVPEDVAISTSSGRAPLHTSTSDRTLCATAAMRRDLASARRKKRHSSLSEGAGVAMDCERATTRQFHRDSDEGSCDDRTFQFRRKVVFDCSLEEKEDHKVELSSLDATQRAEDLNTTDTQSDETTLVYEEESEDREDDEQEDRQSYSSDDSYVKVVPFATTSLYTDLTDFAQEVHVAPRDLVSSFKESASDLAKQIDEFREKAPVFDNFVASLRGLDENSTARYHGDEEQQHHQ